MLLLRGLRVFLLAEGAIASEVKVACLLAPAAAHIPDASAAVKVVQILSKHLKLEIDLKPLETGARQLHQAMSKANKDAGGSPYGSSADAPANLYN